MKSLPIATAAAAACAGLLTGCGGEPPSPDPPSPMPGALPGTAHYFCYTPELGKTAAIVTLRRSNFNNVFSLAADSGNVNSDSWDRYAGPHSVLRDFTFEQQGGDPWKYLKTGGGVEVNSGSGEIVMSGLPGGPVTRAACEGATNLYELLGRQLWGITRSIALYQKVVLPTGIIPPMVKNMLFPGLHVPMPNVGDPNAAPSVVGPARHLESYAGEHCTLVQRGPQGHWVAGKLVGTLKTGEGGGPPTLQVRLVKLLRSSDGSRHSEEVSNLGAMQFQSTTQGGARNSWTPHGLNDNDPRLDYELDFTANGKAVYLHESGAPLRLTVEMTRAACTDLAQLEKSPDAYIKDANTAAATAVVPDLNDQVPGGPMFNGEHPHMPNPGNLAGGHTNMTGGQAMTAAGYNSAVAGHHNMVAGQHNMVAGQHNMVPGYSSAAPLYTDGPPLHSNAAPVHSNAAPVHSNAAPVYTNTAPGQQNTAFGAANAGGHVNQTGGGYGYTGRGQTNQAGGQANGGPGHDFGQTNQAGGQANGGPGRAFGQTNQAGHVNQTGGGYAGLDFGYNGRGQTNQAGGQANGGPGHDLGQTNQAGGQANGGPGRGFGQANQAGGQPNVGDGHANQTGGGYANVGAGYTGTGAGYANAAGGQGVPVYSNTSGLPHVNPGRMGHGGGYAGQK